VYFVAESCIGEGEEMELIKGGKLTQNLLFKLVQFAEGFHVLFNLTFTWQRLETMVGGTPDIDIRLLKEKIVYHGDRQIRFFWEILEDINANDRKAFLQFVWGAFDKGWLWKRFLQDHGSLIAGYTSGGQNMHFPVAHTCFFQIELPR